MKDVATNMPDYESAYANERLEVPEYFNFGFDVVDKWADDRTKLALLSVDSSGENVQHHTFWDLKILSNKYANTLRERGIKKGDRVTIYLPMIPEIAVAVLACARIGAIHSVVFGGFSPEALAGRIIDCKSKVVITADEGIRAGKKISLKANVDDALTNPETSSIQKGRRTVIQFQISSDDDDDE